MPRRLSIYMFSVLLSSRYTYDLGRVKYSGMRNDQTICLGHVLMPLQPKRLC